MNVEDNEVTGAKPRTRICRKVSLVRPTDSEVFAEVKRAEHPGGAEHRAKRWNMDSQVGAATILIQV